MLIPAKEPYRVFSIDGTKIKANASKHSAVSYKRDQMRKEGKGKHYEQSYNARDAVDTEGKMLILGKYVTAHVNDKLELAPGVKNVDPAVRSVCNVSADTGYFSEKAVLTVEADGEWPTVFCAVEKTGIIKSVIGFRQFLLRELNLNGIL